MKNEIKEILECLEKYGQLTPDAIDDLHYIRDYITNLQTIEQQYSAILSENAELENKITNLEQENERLLKTQEMYENKCNKIHKYITQNCEIIRHKDYDEVGKVNGGHILTLLTGGDEE